MNGLDFIDMIMGRLEEDPNKVKKVMKEFKEKYPYADVIHLPNHGVRAWVRFFENGNRCYCMYCGTEMNNRMNQYVKKGEWVKMKRNNNISSWECPKCSPMHGSMPIGVLNDDIFKKKGE